MINTQIKALPNLQQLDEVSLREKFIVTELNFKVIAPIKFSLVSVSSFQVASGVTDVELFSLPAKAIIEWVYLKHSVAFSGGTMTGCKLSLGVAGQLERYLPPFDIFQAPSDTAFAGAAVQDLQNFGAVTSIRLAIVSEGALLSSLSTGKVDVWVKFAQLP